MTIPVELRAAAELELRRGLAEIHGQIGNDAIPADQTFLEWCRAMAERGLKVDGKLFRLDDRPALIPIYEAIPTTREDAAKLTLTIMKATQLGLTIWETLACLYMALKWAPVSIGMFLPSQAVALHKSEHRFMRIVRSSPHLYKLLTHGSDVDGQPVKVGEGNVLTRRIGESLLLFLWTTGKVTTESIPMDVVTLDEVQEMTLDQIDKVQARTGDSDIQFTLLLSTANMPELDIDHWYRMGTQEVWHTECQACGELSDLSDPAGIFPSRSIRYDAAAMDFEWCCPACEARIENPQAGRYIPQNPGAGERMRSFLLPRTISPRITPRDMIESWHRAKTGDQKKSFYNRTLARPYIDADQLPVTMAGCLACVAEGAKAGVQWRQSAQETYMGIDQMGGFNAVLIAERLADGRMAIIHVEAVFDLDPFERCAAMMDQYGVAMCVVEQLPNVNDARKFANRFRGRVFLAGYADLRDDMLMWGDDQSRSDRKTAEDDRSRYTVTLNQYKMMQTSLYRVRDKFVLFPPPEDLEQDVIDNGKLRRLVILRDWVFLHFTKTALVVTQDEHERKPRAKVHKVGIDPHFSFAFMLLNAAWARNHGTGMFILPQPSAADRQREHLIQSIPGLPAAVVRALEPLPEAEVCGRCTAFKDGFCSERFNVRVRERDPGCHLFIPS